MAKINKTLKFQKATINMDDSTITEYLKDCTNTYKIKEILDSWNGVEGISLTIQQNDELEPASPSDSFEEDCEEGD